LQSVVYSINVKIEVTITENGQKEVILKIEDVKKEYHMGEVTVQALQGVSFEI